MSKIAVREFTPLTGLGSFRMPEMEVASTEMAQFRPMALQPVPSMSFSFGKTPSKFKFAQREMHNTDGSWQKETILEMEWNN